MNISFLVSSWFWCQHVSTWKAELKTPVLKTSVVHLINIILTWVHGRHKLRRAKTDHFTEHCCVIYISKWKCTKNIIVFLLPHSETLCLSWAKNLEFQWPLGFGKLSGEFTFKVIVLDAYHRLQDLFWIKRVTERVGQRTEAVNNHRMIYKHSREHQQNTRHKCVYKESRWCCKVTDSNLVQNTLNTRSFQNCCISFCWLQWSIKQYSKWCRETGITLDTCTDINTTEHLLQTNQSIPSKTTAQVNRFSFTTDTLEHYHCSFHMRHVDVK